MKGWSLAVAGAAIAALTFAAASWFFTHDDCDETAAYDAFKLAMEQHLRAPSTAKYQPWDQVSTEAGKTCIFGLTGYLESQNGFGAMTKTEFTGETLRTVDGDYLAVVYMINGRLPGI